MPHQLSYYRRWDVPTGKQRLRAATRDDYDTVRQALAAELAMARPRTRLVAAMKDTLHRIAPAIVI